MRYSTTAFRIIFAIIVLCLIVVPARNASAATAATLYAANNGVDSVTKPFATQPFGIL
jgi:hypothetical protein